MTRGANESCQNTTSSGLSRILIFLRARVFDSSLVSFTDDVPDSFGKVIEVDGTTHVQMFYYIYLPLTKRGIGAAAIISFILT